MLRLLKVATPATALTLVVPASVPPPGLVAIASVTVPVNPVAVLLEPSSAVTTTAGVMVAPAVVVVGCTVIASCVAGATLTLKAGLVAEVSPVALPTSV